VQTAERLHSDVHSLAHGVRIAHVSLDSATALQARIDIANELVEAVAVMPGQNDPCASGEQAARDALADTGCRSRYQGHAIEEFSHGAAAPVRLHVQNGAETRQFPAVRSRACPRP